MTESRQSTILNKNTVPQPAARYILVILLLCFSVYFNTLFNGFVYDDHFQILENRWMKDVRYIPEIFSKNVWEFEGEISNYYRPMMHMIYMLSYYLFGLQPWGFHLVNLWLHAGVSVLVFLTTFRVLTASGTFPAASSLSASFLAALLFAAHPVHTEVVAWVAGVPELSFAFFYLLSFYLYIRTGTGGKAHDRLSAASFFLATFCKETALTLPAILMAYDFAFRKRSNRPFDLLKRYIPFLLATGTYLAVRFSVLEDFTPLKRHSELNAYQYFINIFPLFSQYIEKLLLPMNLSAFHVLHPILSILTLKGLLSLGVTAAFGALVLIAFRKYPAAFLSLVLIAIPLLPVLYIPGLGENTFAERYLYLPSFGFVLLAASGIAWIRGNKPEWVTVVTLGLIILTGLYGWGTVQRNPVWKDEASLWTDTVKKSPDSAFARNELGIAYAAWGRIDEAVEQYRTALRLRPDFARAYNNLGMVYADKGWIDQAIVQFENALRVKPDFAKAENNLGIAYARKGWIDQAIVHYQAALTLKPDAAEIHINLGNAYDEKGWIDKAMEEYRTALQLEPDSADAHMHIGIAYGEQGRIDKAIDHFQAALRLTPQDPVVHRNLANAYRIQGLPGKAEEHLRKAKSLEQ